VFVHCLTGSLSVVHTIFVLILLYIHSILKPPGAFISLRMYSGKYFPAGVDKVSLIRTLSLSNLDSYSRS
jgi:hypothetical protein